MLKETKSSARANSNIQFILGVMNEGPLCRNDTADLQSTIKDYIYSIYVPCRHLLRPYDVNTCGVCGGGRCADYELKYDAQGYPHIYIFEEDVCVDDEDYDW